jgi:hypothetical protein
MSDQYDHQEEDAEVKNPTFEAEEAKLGPVRLTDVRSTTAPITLLSVLALLLSLISVGVILLQVIL